MGSRQVALQTGISSAEPQTQNQHGTKSKADNFQSEHEKFLEDFEKPTAIYRLIRAKSLANPRFLYRNLSYMRNRMSRKKKTREKFDLNSMLKRVTEEQEEEHRVNAMLDKNMPNYLNIIILGLCDSESWAPTTEAKVDIQILRISCSKRKGAQISISKPYSSSCCIAVKSQTAEDSVFKEFSVPIPKGKYPVMSIHKDSLNLVNGHIVQSLRLAVRVSIPVSRLTSKTDTAKKDSKLNSNGIENFDIEKSGKGGCRLSLPANTNGIINGVSLRRTNNGADNTSNGDKDEPKAKRLRSIPTKDRENLVYKETNKVKNNTSKVKNGDSSNLVYVGMFTIYDRDSNINIPAGGNADLEILLNKSESKIKNGFSKKKVRKEGSWEVSLQPDHSKVKEYFLRNGRIGSSAKIAIAFRGSGDKMESTITMIEPVTPSIQATNETADDEEEMENTRIVYYFMNRGNAPKQTTECRNDFRCPWCSINCLVLYSLLKHLEVCHPRFKFTFRPITNGVRAEVSINDAFDGSYAGSAYDLVTQPPGQAFGHLVAPSKRTQVFCMLAFNPRNCKRDNKELSLQEFFENNEEKNGEQNRSYMIGHNRLYHHTTTCLPIHPREIDVDSEGEPDPEWLKVKTCMMIDEFTDVNEGEKNIMKMWNHHVMHENYVGDCQIPLACKRFVERYGQNIIEKNLYRNFILHLTNLFDFGLLPAPEYHKTVQAMHCQMKENNSARSLKKSWMKVSKLFPTETISPHNTPNGDVEPMDTIDGLVKVEACQGNGNNNCKFTANNHNGSSKNGL